MQLKLHQKKWMIIVMAAAGCIFAGGCGAKEPSAEAETSAEETAVEKASAEETTAEETSAEETPSEEMSAAKTTADSETAGEQPETDSEAGEIYSAALEAIFSQNIWPDGKEIDQAEYKSRDFSENQFAVCDADGDGREELLLHVTSASMAGMFEGIYDYDPNTGNIREEFREFPSITYYDNGSIKAEWSHNQGQGAKLWPFTLYEYDRDEDTYVFRGSVDSWDRDVFAEGFPAEYDTDGDGTVYFIYEDRNLSNHRTVDGEEYHQWLDSFLDGAGEIQIDWYDLKEENIKYLKPAG